MPAAPHDADGWLLLAEMQRQRHAMVLQPAHQLWPAAFDASVERRRDCDALNPVQERVAVWLT